MTATVTKPPRIEDPRYPVHRIQALLDDGTMQAITPEDDSGMLAAVGRVNGRRVVVFCSDATVMGGAMGDLGCRVVVDAYHRAMIDSVPIIGLWHSGGARLAATAPPLPTVRTAGRGRRHGRESTARPEPRR